VSGNVKIEIHRSYPLGTWDVLFASEANDGSESWVVTAPASPTCRMRISSVSDPSIQDISNSSFTIVQGVPSKASIVASGDIPCPGRGTAQSGLGGENGAGQLGLGDATNRSSPVQVPINLNP
jgi:hypothetical protein